MIKVIIERFVAESLESTYLNYMQETMQELSKFPGYVKGYSLQDKHDSRHFIVISNWKAECHWDKWLHSNERRAVIDRIQPLLDGPEKHTILEIPNQ
ncbi:MAG: antibiotic biosynthesis monooxygenase [Gammaproteobacteria bacterium]|nr:MAG: antibiotic biosynthesis monooxygenase [Gammaproteobacteria bacterium]